MARLRAWRDKSGLRATLRIGASRRAQSSAAPATSRDLAQDRHGAVVIGGSISGAISDLTGSYQAAFLNGIAWNLLNMSIVFWFLLGRPRWRDSARQLGVDLSPSRTSKAFARFELQNGLYIDQPRTADSDPKLP
jgi:hypothetical protein